MTIASSVRPSNWPPISPLQSDGAREVCPICHKRVVLLARHVNSVHLNIRRHKCDECGMAFSQRYSLTEHKLRKHSHNRQHECDFCGKKFAIKSEMHRHRKLLHTQWQSSDGWRSPHWSRRDPRGCHCSTNHQPCLLVCLQGGEECPVCHNRYIYMKKHYREVHLKEKKFTCSVCGARFTQQGSLRGHMQRKHSQEKAYSCHICGKRFAVKIDMSRHAKMHMVPDNWQPQNSQ